MELIEGENARWCLKCNVLKHFGNFHKQKEGKYGYTSKCKNCKNKAKRIWRKNNPDYYKKYAEENKEKLNKRKIEWANDNPEKVKKAKKDWRDKNPEYHKKYREENIDYLLKYEKEYYQNNKEEILEKTKEYYEENKEYLAVKRKEWYENNKEEILEQSKKYREENKESINEYKRKWGKDNYDNNIQYKIRTVTSARIRRALSNNHKSKSSRELLGCTIKELKQHLEDQWEEGMAWDNWTIDGWHIDHIKPCASFDLSDPEQQKECFHYTNLQPLWAEDNLKKSDKILDNENNNE